MVDVFKEVIFPILALFVAIFIIIAAPSVLFGYYRACKEAGVFNKINSTEYTCSDFFWASKQINNNTQTIKLK